MNIARTAQRGRLRLVIPALVMAIAALIIPLSQTASAHTATRAAVSDGPKPTIVLEHGACLGRHQQLERRHQAAASRRLHRVRAAEPAAGTEL